MNTTLTEEELVQIKKSLDNSLTLVKRGLRHFSAASPSVTVTPDIQQSVQDYGSLYHSHPEWLYHFQCMDSIIEIHFSRIYRCYTILCENWVPHNNASFLTPLLINTASGSIEIKDLKSLSLVPPDTADLVRRHFNYHKLDTLEEAENTFRNFIYQFLTYDDKLFPEVPF